MREIKFRNFNIKNGMSYDIQRGCGSGGCHCSDLLQDWLNVPENNVMQYTGLKDKNGKEIYEGDVVKCEDMRINNHQNCEVVWDDESASFLLKSIKFGGLWGVADIRLFEVIGNIYENPELLKEVN